MKKTLMMAAIATVSGIAIHAQNIAGDWLGTLKAGTVELRIVLHIADGADGGLKATMDSPDQGANGIPVSSISLKDSKLTFSVDSARGAYEGHVKPDGTLIEGTWSQGRPMPLDFKRASAPAKVEHRQGKPSDIDGYWMGTLDTRLMKVKAVFHITNTEDGLVAALSSPDEGVMETPVAAVTRTDSSLRLEVKQIGATFAGQIGVDLAAIDGTWTTGAGAWPLVLKRVTEKEAFERRRRPQEPVKPYPYREEEVVYENKTASIKLAGTLTIPLGKGPFRAVVLIPGSGPHDRDENLMGHRPFLVLSDYLTRKGIAVLRADDRGVGKSGGSFAGATTANLATDAEAGIAYLKTRSEIDQRKVGLIGHSEGGVIAPMVAARNPAVAFIVMMAGTGVPGSDVWVAQQQLIYETGGMSHAEAENRATSLRAVVTLIKEGGDSPDTEKKLADRLTALLPAGQSPVQVAKMLSSPWFRYFLEYDPATALRKVTCPVLALNGAKDLQVSPRQNLPAIRKALDEAGNKDFEVDELPGLNHLFQTADKGLLIEYAQIEETMSTMALERISRWILAH